MDHVVETIAKFAHEFRYEDIPSDVREFAVHHLIDTLACVVGAINSETNQIVGRLIAPVMPGQDFGRMFGSREHVSADMAAYANTAMIRNLDYNDGYPGGHPSEALGPLFSVAGARDLSGRDFLTAMVIAYEIHNRYAESGKLRFLGWDHATQVSLPGAPALCNLLKLPYDVTCNALSLAAVASVALRVTRSGHLSLWTGAASGMGARDTVFLTNLAANGMTAPPEPFTGRDGMFQKMTGEFTLRPFPPEGKDFLTRGVRHKYWPAEYNAQIGIWAAKELRERVKLEDIVSVTLFTYEWAYFETASEPEKWAPTSPDTANHSLPYLFARMFLTGDLDLESFEPKSFMDPVARDLMGRIRIEHDKEMDTLYPKIVPVRIECVVKNGPPIVFTLTNPRGHNDNPMTRDDTSEKFRKLARGVLPDAQIEEALDFWWSVTDQPGLARGMDLLAKA